LWRADPDHALWTRCQTPVDTGFTAEPARTMLLYPAGRRDHPDFSSHDDATRSSARAVNGRSWMFSTAVMPDVKQE
jgi:hypothetical protein